MYWGHYVNQSKDHQLVILMTHQLYVNDDPIKCTEHKKLTVNEHVDTFINQVPRPQKCYWACAMHECQVNTVL